MPQVRARYRFANTTLRDAAVYVPILDVDQWLEIGSAAPYDLYRITAVSSAGAGTFERVGGAGMTFGAVVAETVGGANVNGVGTDAARNDHVHALPAFGVAAGTFAQGNDSRLSDSRAPNGSAGGDLAGTYPSPSVSGIHETGGPTALTIGTVNDGEFLKRSGATLISAVPPGGGSGSGSKPLYFIPTSPHADDEEFENTSAPSGWELYNRSDSVVITPSGTIDVYTAPGAGVAKAAYHTNWRHSWATIQLAADNKNCTYAKKPASIATNCYIWARISSYQEQANASADGNCMLMIAADTGGHADFNNSVCLGWRGTGASTWVVSAMTVVAGAVTTQGSDTSTRFSDEYFLIHKLNTTYHVYVRGDGGSVLHRGSFTHSSTMSWIGYYIRKSDANARPGLHQFDFIRRGDTATLLPF